MRIVCVSTKSLVNEAVRDKHIAKDYLFTVRSQKKEEEKYFKCIFYALVVINISFCRKNNKNKIFLFSFRASANYGKALFLFI